MDASVGGFIVSPDVLAWSGGIGKGGCVSDFGRGVVVSLVAGVLAGSAAWPGIEMPTFSIASPVMIALALMGSS